MKLRFCCAILVTLLAAFSSLTGRSASPTNSFPEEKILDYLTHLEEGIDRIFHSEPVSPGLEADVDALTRYLNSPADSVPPHYWIAGTLMSGAYNLLADNGKSDNKQLETALSVARDMPGFMDFYYVVVAKELGDRYKEHDPKLSKICHDLALIRLLKTVRESNECDELIPYLAASLYDQNRYDDFVTCLKMADLAGRSDSKRVTAWYGLSELFSQQGDFENAALYLEKSIPGIEKMALAGDIPIDDVLDTKLSLAFYYSRTGKYNTARNIISKLEADPATGKIKKTEIAAEAARLSFGLGDFEETLLRCNNLLAESLLPEQRLEILELKTASLLSLLDLSTEKDSKEYTVRLNEAKDAINQSKTLMQSGNIPSTTDNLVMLGMSEGSLAFLNDDTAEMIRIATELESSINRDIQDEELRNSLLSNLSVFHLKGGNYGKALELVDLDDDNLPEVVDFALYVKSEAYNELGDRKKSKESYEQLSRNIINDVSVKFPLLSEAEKMSFWRKVERQTGNAGRYAEEGNEDDDFGGTVYDLALYSKGILLNSARTFNSIMEASDLPEVKISYNRMKSLRSRLSEDLNLTAEERRNIEEEISGIQLSLFELVPESKNYMARLSYSWQDVQSALDNADTAIEFIELQDVGGKKYYGAAVVTGKTKNPVILNIGSVKEIDSKVRETMNAETVWGKLLPYMDRGGKTYFSAAGNLNCLPIESLLLADGSTLSASYPLYRLTSTRELLGKEFKPGSGMAMFGGIVYGDSSKPGSSEGTHRGTVYNLHYLPGTLREIEEVVEMVEKDHLLPESPKTYIGEHGTEENFRKLSGSSQKIVHIGTHGYYLPSKKEGVSKLPASARRLYKRVDALEDPLLQNGLLFAGVNLNTENNTNSDGVVTALEISTLDFNGTDLVVLSACESGLGKISGDGVFGLQRGFKMAGANSLIISLEKVEDDATRLLMTEFYKRYLGGTSKHNAFEEAKKEVRKQYPSGRQYASFILIDSLD